MVGPSREKTGPRQRRAVLVLLRAAVIALMLLAMLRPTLIYTQTKKQAATLVVLVDQSRSMTVPDAVGNKTRWEEPARCMDDAAPALARLQRDFELKAYTFDADVHEANVEDGKIELPEKPEGQQTAIGASLEDVLRREAGKRLLGVVLLSDGAQRAYAPARSAAADRRRPARNTLGCPLFTLPFGQSRGLGEAQDVAVKDLVVNPNVFVKNELSISGQVRVDGYVNVDIPVRVLFETSPGKMEVVAQQNDQGRPPTANSCRSNLRYIPQTPGEYKLTVEAVKQPGELVTTNNELSTFVNVLKGGLNVLYIEGSVAGRGEVHPPCVGFLARHQGRLRAARSPRSARAGQPISRNVSNRANTTSTSSATSIRRPFSGDELAELAKCVNRGAGLIMLGGFQSFRARRIRRHAAGQACCRWAWIGSNGSSPTSRCVPICIGPAR